MFALSAKFRKSRCAGGEGAVCYVIREGKNERCITGGIRGQDSHVLSAERERIAFDLKTIYCVIESLDHGHADVTLDDVADMCRPAFAGDNPYAARIETLGDRFPVDRRIATISRLYADSYEAVSPTTDGGDGILVFINRLAAEYQADGKPYFQSLRSTHGSMSRFLGGQDIPLHDVDCDTIASYGKYLEAHVSPETAAFYLRTLRLVMNRAGEKGLSNLSFAWPDSVKTAVTPSGKGSGSKGLDLATLSRLEEADFGNDDNLGFVRDIFLFSFYAGGMELVDIANLRRANLSGDILTYSRRLKGKTMRTHLAEKALSIIRRYDDGTRDYLFPILQRERSYTFRYARNEIANALVDIGHRMGYPGRLTFSMSRYSVQEIIHTPDILERLIS